MAKKEINLNGYIVNEVSFPYLIAEIGINHNGDINIAQKLIDAANCCEWNCVKFQKRDPDIAVPKEQRDVIRDTPWGQMSYLDYKKHIEFNQDNYDKIDRYCKEKSLAWTASPWDIPSTEFLLQYDVPFIKIASAVNNNEEIIKISADRKKPLIVSTGMSTLKEIDTTVEILEKYTNGNYILMHTNSTYPTLPGDANIKMIDTLRERYNCLVGYSGHEYGILPTIIAASYGACVIERHITLSREMWGTDQAASLELDAMYRLRQKIEEVKDILGSGQKVLSKEEMEIRKKLRGK